MVRLVCRWRDGNDLPYWKYILLAPRLGAGELIGLVVAGQLIFSVLLDHFGWVGFAQHSASLPRLAGCAFMIVGVFLIAKF